MLGFVFSVILLRFGGGLEGWVILYIEYEVRFSLKEGGVEDRYNLEIVGCWKYGMVVYFCDFI